MTVSPGEIVGHSTQESTGTVTLTQTSTVTTQVLLSGSAGLTFYQNGQGVSAIYIPAGGLTAQFQIRSGDVSTTTVRTVQAQVYSSVNANLTVTPLYATFSISPSSIVGGSTQDSVGTVTFAAPTLGQVSCGLASAPLAVTFSAVPNGIPASGIIVADGASSGTFYMRTGAQGTATETTITASCGYSKQAILTVQPPTLSISLSPSSLFGNSGQSSTGTVTLGAPTRGNASVGLSKGPNLPVLTGFPVAVIVYAGNSSGTFTFQAANPGTTTKTDNIKATYSTIEALTPLTVYPPNGNEDLGPCKDCNAGVGAPINLTTGNTWIQQRDYSLPGLGGGLELVRTWNSLWTSNSPIETSGMFGHSWRSNYEERLVAGNPLKYWRGDGSGWLFSYDSINQTYGIISPLDEQVVLTYDSGTTLYTMTFQDGSKKQFNNSGYLTKIIDRNGNQTTITYDGTNRITSVTDSASRSITFTYPNGTTRQVQSVADSVGTFASYLYDGTPRLTKVTYADSSFNTFIYNTTNSLLLEVKDTSAKILEKHTYGGSSGRQGLTSERANGIEKVTVSYATAGVPRVTDSLNNITDYTHQPVGARRWITQVTGPGCVTCGGRGDQSFTYDLKGRKLSATDALGRTTTFTYDIFDNLVTRSVQLNAQTTLTWTYTYNSLGQVLTATDPAGNVTTNTYSSAGNLLTTTTPPPASGQTASTTTFAYNSLGQLTSITDPRNNATTIAYNSVGLISTVTDANNKTTTYAYDARGNRTSVTDALNNVTTFTYNNMNRLTQITQPGSVVTQFAYDNRGRRTSVTDANNKATTYAYDDADRLTSVTDAATNVTQYTYDTENNLLTITDALLRSTSFAYDARGRVTTTTFPSTLAETYTYDAMGNLLTKTDRKNQTLTYTYDNLDRLTRKQYPDSSGVDYTYDNLSRLTRVVDATGTYDFAYDNLGRLTSATSAYAFLTSRNFVVSYGYDLASNRTSMTDPESGATSYSYDALNRLTSLTPPSAFTSGNFGFTYDALSRRTQMTRPNSVNTDYAYDTLSRLTSILHKLSGNTIDGVSYSVDNVGNRTSKTPQPGGTAFNFSYDNIYQLTQVTQGAATPETYTYDVVGNRLSSVGVSPYVYNSSNQLTSAPNTTYTYDNNGNTLTKTDSSGTTTYSWDHENRLVSVALPNSGGTVSFTYDPLGRRIQKVFGSATTIYAYDGENIVEETDASGTAQARFAMGLSIDEPLAQLRSSTTHFYNADGLGSITSLTDSSGSVAASYTYDSFGNLTASTGSLTNPFRYTAREWDSEAGLYFYRARYYDTTTGRFLSEDPARFFAALNFYDYVGGNPIRFVDPTGMYYQDIRELRDTSSKVGLRIALEGWDLARQSLSDAEQWAKVHGFPPESLHNGPPDAFRHCIWSCLMAQQLGEENAKIIAHEHEQRGRRDRQQRDEELMDRANNAVGRQCAKKKGDCHQECTYAYTHSLLHGPDARRDFFPHAEPQ